MHEVTCVGCGTVFEAKSARAKWCGAACRKRVQRAAARNRPAARRTPAATAKKSTVGGRRQAKPLVAAVRKELELADRLDTVDGQIAVLLAEQAAVAAGSAASKLTDSLRLAVDRALGLGTRPAGGGEPDDDEVTRARKAREEAREAVGFS